MLLVKFVNVDAGSLGQESSEDGHISFVEGSLFSCPVILLHLLELSHFAIYILSGALLLF